MEISQHCVVALTWTLTDTEGDELNVLDEALEFLVGGDDLLPRIEQALQGQRPGARLALQIEPSEAFGEFDAQLLLLAPRALLPAAIEEGMLFEGSALPAGLAPQQARPGVLYAVTDLYPEHVLLDGNHPLAGIALRLQLTVQAVRPATAEEIGRRSAGASFFQLHV